MRNPLIISAVGIALASCTNVLWVKEQEPSATSAAGASSDNTQAGADPTYRKVPGIPFYVKTEKLRQSTVYSQTWLRATLLVEKKLADTKDGKEVLIDTAKQEYTKNLAKPISKELTAIKTGILRANRSSEDDALRIIDEFQALTDVDAATSNTDLVSNAVDSTWVVDRARVYYLNAPLPWFGSGSLTQKLNSDGTLSEATSTPDTKLAEGISSLIPFKEFLTGEFVKPATQAAQDDDKKTDVATAMRAFRSADPASTLATKQYVYVLSLSIEEIGYEHTLIKPSDTPLTNVNPIPFDDRNNGTILYSRKAIGPAAKPQEKKEAGTTIGIAGSINFPKDWPVPKP